MWSLFASLVVVVSLAPTARCADTKEQENPFKNAKVGDWAEYNMVMMVGPLELKGKSKMVVTAKDDKEVTLKTTSTINGMETPAQEAKIDLTKPYDPTQTTGIPGAKDLKVEKKGEGEEKVKVGDKEYKTQWTKMKVTGKAQKQDIDADMKYWTSKDVPLSGMVKMESTSKIGGMEIKMTMELIETGSKK